MEAPIFIHKTHLQTWIDCPMKYKLWFIDRQTFEPTIGMQVGQQFHDFARDFFEFIDYEALASAATLGDILKVFKPLVIFERMPPILRQLCENFVQFEAKRYELLMKQTDDPIYYFTPVAREVFLRDERQLIEGTIDRIDRLRDETLCIIEYKTGRPEIRVAKRELAFYALLVHVRQRFEKPVTHLAVYNPDQNKFHVQPVRRRVLQVARRRLQQFRKAHELGVFPPRPGPRCAWCPFKICEEYGGGESESNIESAYS